MQWGRARRTDNKDGWVDVTFLRRFGTLYSITYSIMNSDTLANQRVISSQSGYTPTENGFRVQCLSTSTPLRYTYWMAIGTM